MQSVCQLRLYTDDNRLLTGCPRFLRSSESASSPTNSTSTLLPKAISIQPSDFPELHTSNLPNKNMSSQKRTSRTFQQRGSINKRPSQFSSLLDNQNNSSATQKEQRQAQSSAQYSTCKAPDTHHPTPCSLPKVEPVEDSSQLVLILAKLNELELIKTHLTTIDTRLNLLQPQLLHIATMAQCS